MRLPYTFTTIAILAGCPCRRDVRGRAVRGGYNKEAVLRAWAKGLTCGQICHALGMARPQAVSVIVQRARKQGDARAAERRPRKFRT